MFKVEKLSDKAVLTVYGYVGGYYMDMRAVNSAISDIQQSGYKQLDFHMHTYGGSVIDGNLIYNFLAGFSGNVDIYIDGIAASMGSIIMLAGKNKPQIAENGFIMIHSPSGYAEGTVADLNSCADLLSMMEKNFRQKLISVTGKSEDDINALFDGTDHWFDADKAIAFGLASGKFSAKVQDLAAINTTEASQLGAKAVFDRFSALTQNMLNQPPKNKMDKKTIITRYKLTNVTEANTEEEIYAAIDAKLSSATTAATTAEQNAADVVKTAITAAVDQAILDKKITKELRDSYIARGEKLGLADLNAVFADMHPYQPISGKIVGTAGGEKVAEDRKGWTWNDYQAKAADELEAMPQTNPDLFIALYKAEYKTEPEL